MLDISNLKEKAKTKAKQKVNSFLADQFPNMGATPGAGIAERRVEGQPYGWAGMTQQQALGKYNDLKALGIQHKSFYVVRFMPSNNTFAKNVPLLEMDNATWLATEVSAPIIQLDTESKKVGHYTINHVTGSQSPEITITFIETAENDVLNSLKAMRRFICKADGTQALPGEYCFFLDIWLYSRKEGWTKPKGGERFKVFISQANLELSSAESDALLIPITFTQSRRFMKS